MDAYQDQKDVYRGVIEAVSDGNLAALDGLMAPDMIDHNPMPGQAPGALGALEQLGAQVVPPRT